MEAHRAERVSEALREELAELIGYEMSDPRIGSVEVTEVVVAPDMRQARVRISLAGDERARDEALRALDGARHFLRRELAGRLRLFRIPELFFEADVSAGGRDRLEQLLKRIRKGRPRPDSAEAVLAAPAGPSRGVRSGRRRTKGENPGPTEPDLGASAPHLKRACSEEDGIEREHECSSKENTAE